jgi:hypothetical protein
MDKVVTIGSAPTAPLDLPGAVAGTGVEAEEYMGGTHKTVITLVDHSLTITDVPGTSGYGGTKVYDFPAGIIQIMGCSFDLDIERVGTNIAATAAVVGSLGTVTAANDNATLTSTEANLIASTAGTLTAGVGALESYLSLVAAAFDGHTTPIDAFLNIAIPDAECAGDDAILVNGTITIVWANLGDY